MCLLFRFVEGEVACALDNCEGLFVSPGKVKLSSILAPMRTNGPGLAFFHRDSAPRYLRDGQLSQTKHAIGK